MKGIKTIYVYLFLGLCHYAFILLIILLFVCVVAGPSAPAAAAGSAPGRGGVPDRGRALVDPVPFNCYNDPDADNPIPPFTPSWPAGIHFRQRLLRGTMTKAVEFTFFYRRNDKYSS